MADIPSILFNLRLVASLRSKAGVASVPPRSTDTPPRLTELLESFALAIDPASCAFVIVPVNEEVG